MAEPSKEVPTDPAAAPVGAGEGETTSKKGAKKAEAKAKKEAEKARKAAEREAAQAQSVAAAAEDLAKDNYGEFTHKTKIDAQEVDLKALGEEHVGKTINVRGYIQNSRAQGAKMVFVELRTIGSWAIQALVAASTDGKPVSKQMVKWVGGIKLESLVEVEAIVQKPLEPVKSTRVSNYELHLQKVYLVQTAPEMLGLTFASASVKAGRIEDDEEDEAASKLEALSVAEGGGTPSASLATHLNNPAMHKRAPISVAIADIRHGVEKLFRDYLEDRGFRSFHPPCLIGAASEGGANVFALKYWEKQAFLAQSPQFYKQFEIAGGRKRVYCVGPVFRAENSNTPRHMTEFIGLDLEMEIKTHYHEVMHMLEGVLLHIFKGLASKYREEIELVRSIYPSEEFLLPEDGKEVRLTFAEGQKLLREEGPEEFKNVSDDEDMSTPQEKALGALIRKKYKTDFYVLDKFPTEARPFYALPDPENPKVTNAYDFMMRGQEILSGGQRVHKPEQLVETIKSKGLDPNQPGLKEYVDVFRSVGVPPHGGGGIGLDRVVAWYLNLPSVHLVADYPRTPKRLTP